MPKYAKSAKRFRAALERLCMTQTAFAEAVEQGDRHIRKYVAGDVEVPKLVWMAVELLEIKDRRGDRP